MIPKEIDKYIKKLKYTKDLVGRSEDDVYLFEEKYVLKVSKNIEILKREKEIFDFLETQNIPGSRSICFVVEKSKAYYLRTFIKGESLISERFINNPDILIETIVNVIEKIRKIDSTNCKIKSTDNIGNSFIHGDLCLPNILVNQNNDLVGLIDLGNAGVGDEWYDYSWLLWSFEYNLKTNKYNNKLLEKLNIEFNEEKYNKYIPEEYR